MLRVGFAQINTTVGAFDENLEKITNFIETAKSNKVDILLFPELSFIGYPPKDLLLKKQFLQKNLEALKIIKDCSKGIGVVVGFIEKKKDKLYNSLVFLYDKKILALHYKFNLLKSTFFDETKYFSSGDGLTTFSFKGYSVALTVGEDIFSESIKRHTKITKLDFLINISACPFYLGKFNSYIDSLLKIAKSLKLAIFVCNLVGGQDEVVFDGTSLAISAEGKIIFVCKSFKEDFQFFDFDKKVKYKSLSISKDEVESVYNSLVLATRDYAYKNNFKSAVVGVSGGIDSAVVVSLATAALGNKNVVGLILPTKFNKKETVEDAEKICRNLKIEYKIIDIQGIFDNFLLLLKPFFEGKKHDVTEENIQSRIRAIVLMAFSNKFGHLVLNTGNKSELYCGYCTLYGDLIGGFSVLKDIYKSFVYKLAEYINKIFNPAPIPETVFKRAPSAELKENQKDSDILPEYSLLDPLLKFYLEDDLNPSQILKKGYNIELVNRVTKMIYKSEYKRKQAPLGLNVTYQSIFCRKTIPITNKFFDQ